MTELLPTHHWEASEKGLHYPAVMAAVESLQAEAVEAQKQRLLESVDYDRFDLPMSHLTEEGDSDKAVILVPSQYVNELSLHNLLAADLLRQSAKNAGVTDSDGDHLSVVSFAAPVRKHDIDIPEGVDAVEHITDMQIRALQAMGYEVVLPIGYSQAGTIAAATGARGPGLGIDVPYFAAGEPADGGKIVRRNGHGVIVDRNRIEMAVAFSKVPLSAYEAQMQQSELSRFHEYFKGDAPGESSSKLADMITGFEEQLQIAANSLTETNRLHLPRALGRATLYENLGNALKHGSSGVVICGTESAVCNPRIVVPGLAMVALVSDLEHEAYGHRREIGTLNVITMPGNHALSNKPERITTAYLDDMPQEVSV